MKIALDKSVDLEFDRWALERAGEIIQYARGKHRDRAEDVLRGMLTLLLFGQIENQCPGTLNGIMDESKRIAEALKGPQPTKE